MDSATWIKLRRPTAKIEQLPNELLIFIAEGCGDQKYLARLAVDSRPQGGHHVLLHIAAHTAVLRVLLEEAGTPVDGRDLYGETPLFRAALVELGAFLDGACSAADGLLPGANNFLDD
ncbi:uncharacterized protein PG986_012413 [Apiospora aurea]|uniref:Uncharacterized protein n=1 Tax=Apiospora aurea TaxID=335848 RepID=A0ABR1PZX5_9PEZI